MHSEHEVKHEPEVILAVSVNSKIRKQNSLLHNLKIHSPIWTPKTKDNGELNLQIWWPISFTLLSRPTTKLRCWLPERNSSWSRQPLPGMTTSTTHNCYSWSFGDSRKLPPSFVTPLKELLRLEAIGRGRAPDLNSSFLDRLEATATRCFWIITMMLTMPTKNHQS